MNEYHVRYGREYISFNLPDEAVLQPLQGQPMEALPDAKKALREALADPIGRPPLALMAGKRSSALVVVADHTRNNAYELWLAELFNQLNAAGIPDSRIELYVASGTHRASTAEEKRMRYGEEVIKRAAAIIDHDCDAADLEKVGRTDAGTIVYVSNRVYKAELLLLTGGIQYHYFAGYTGGRKAILPGVAGRLSIRTNHTRAYDPKLRNFAAGVQPGLLVGNPVSDDMHDAAVLLRPDLCVNVVLNDAKQVGWLGAGDFSYVLRLGAQFLDAHNRLPVTRLADFAIVGAGGYPKDLNLFQAHKSLRHASFAVAEGGTIIWLARCDEGEGPAVMEQLRQLQLEELHENLRTDFNLGSGCSFSLRTLAQRFRIHMVTELDAAIVSGWGITPHASMEAALAATSPELYSSTWSVFAPDMSNLLPELQVGEAESDPEQQGAEVPAAGG